MKAGPDEAGSVGAGVDDGTANFVRLALFYAWHVAQAGKIAAQQLQCAKQRGAGVIPLA